MSSLHKTAMREIGPDDNCDRDCVECRPQFVTAPVFEGEQPEEIIEQVNDAKANQTTTDLARQIESDHRYLQDKLHRYGDAIRARWKKKGQAKREAVLLQAQPSLYIQKWPELRTIFGYDKDTEGEAVRVMASDTTRIEEIQHQQETVRNGLLLPYLNVHTLKEDPMKLLSLLHLRSTYKPEDWVMSDVTQMKRGANNCSLSQRYNENCVIMYGKRYGQLVPWDRAECHRWNYLGYPRAVLVLEAQNVLMSFLRKVADIIVPPGTSKEGNAEWTTLITSGFRSSGEVEYWSSISNPSFSPPPVLNPASILAAAEAQLRAAEDHFFLLQTDPAYFHHLLAAQRRGEHYAQVLSEKVWKLFASEYMLYPIKHVQRLRDLVDECKNVLSVHQQHQSAIKVGSVPPTNYERALMALELLCINLYQVEREVLVFLIRKTPGFNRNFEYVTNEKGERASITRFIGNPRKAQSANEWYEPYYRQEPLFFGLYHLCQDPEHIDTFSIPLLMSFIDDHLAHADKKERARIDQKLYDHLGRMSIYAEVFLSLRLQRPLHAADAFTYEIATNEEKQRRTWRLWSSTPDALTDAETSQLSSHLQAFYASSLPTGKKDQSWLEKAEENQAALEEFWKIAHDIRERQITSIGLIDSDRDEDLELFSARDSAEFKADWANELQELQNAIKAQDRTTQMEKQEYPAQSVWGQSNDEKVTPMLPVRKEKMKRRPENAVSSKAAAADVAVNAEEETRLENAKIVVNPESLRIFARVFPSSAEIAFKGVVKWQQFVTAMTDAGCSATHTGGSCVRFEVPAHAPAAETGAIVFHKPHPDNELDAVMLHTMGKRLRSWFGWEASLFIERKKGV